jgi:adenine-specific DNA-methyltransferase
VGSQRRGRIDPNPHQIDAVMFALRRIPEGGCVLADEVGLGKTIEAGLVLAQLLAEGASRILIVVPKPLLGQWQDELFTLFDIEAWEGDDEAVDRNGPGVFLIGREYAGGARGFAKLSTAPPFDLWVIDEAHEVFAGIHRRFDRHGAYHDESPHARTAHRVRELIGPAPVLLLTATPIQNSLLELWGLLQYVEPTGTLLGSLPTFKELFCQPGDVRRLARGQAPELRRRLGGVVQRTLRRQAQEFLDQPFVARSTRLFEYSMSPEEKSLYDDVTEYLLEPGLCAFQGSSRQLLLLSFHRLMASSTAALAQSLVNVAQRLRKLQLGEGEQALDETAAQFAGDLEEDESPREPGPETGEARPASDDAPPAAEHVARELARVESFVRRARSLPHDSKAESLLEAVGLVSSRAKGSAKIVVFTESITTQEYLRRLLIERGCIPDGEITLFRGVNDSARAREALERWNEELRAKLPPHSRPSPGVAVRLALVHEFKTRSRVFISTEAGAKGLNLQFCDTIINYDLPWNPQRIEQRIGRCHRYGQKRDVTVINFLARDNEAQRLTFEILSQKLELFGQVLDMSDAVLHAPRSEHTEEMATTLGPDFGAQLRRIWERSRSLGEVERELRQLRDSMEERRLELDQAREQTLGLIEGRLDENVRQVFKHIQAALPETLAELDRDLERIVVAYLAAIDVPFELKQREGRRLLEVAPSPRLPESLAQGLTVAFGHARELGEVESLHAAHPLVQAAVAEARAAGRGRFAVRFRLTDDAPERLRKRRGARGRLALTRVEYRGFEREDRFVATALFENQEVLRPADAALELLKLPCEALERLDPALAVAAEDLDEVVDEELFHAQTAVEATEQQQFERAIDQIDQFMEDRLLVKRRVHEALSERLRKAEVERDAALGADARIRADEALQRLGSELEQLEGEIGRLAAREDDAFERWRERAHGRRYRPPRSERLFDLEFTLE